ncbi:MAG: hypothetical protein AAGA95_09455, partial [Pseudomonadota bacterium]
MISASTKKRWAALAVSGVIALLTAVPGVAKSFDRSAARADAGAWQARAALRQERRISQRLEEQAASRPDERVRLIVTYKDHPDAYDTDHVKRLDGSLRREFELIDSQAVTTRAADVSRILENPHVKGVVIDDPITLAGSSGELNSSLKANRSRISLQSKPGGASTPSRSFPTAPVFAFNAADKFHMASIDGRG